MKTVILAFLLSLLSFLSLASTAEAAICYVRDGGTATGSNGCDGSGGNWTNAYDQLSSAETAAARGDTIYVADGTYSGVTFNTTNSGSTLITIKKATVSDHGTATGWSDAFGDGVATVGPLTFTSSFWEFDGQTGGGPGAWNTGFGFEVDHSGTAGPGIRFSGGDNITIRHVKTIGNFGSSDSNSDSFSWSSGQSDNITVSYFWAFNAGRTIIFCNQSADNVLFEFGFFGEIQGFGSVHGETASIWGNPSDWTIRYSLVTGIDSTGGIMWDNHVSPSGSLWVYGNVFYDIGEAWGEHGNGVIGGWTGGNDEEAHNIKVYNNTFITVSDGTAALGSNPNIRSGLEARNNLFYAVDNVDGSIWTMTHNHYISSEVVGTNTSTSSGDPFEDFVNFDFQLTAGTTAGTTLVSPFDVDMLGNVRGADGTWDRGALEFVEGGGGGGSGHGLLKNVIPGFRGRR